MTPAGTRFDIATAVKLVVYLFTCPDILFKFCYTHFDQFVREDKILVTEWPSNLIVSDVQSWALLAMIDRFSQLLTGRPNPSGVFIHRKCGSGKYYTQIKQKRDL